MNVKEWYARAWNGGVSPIPTLPRPPIGPMPMPPQPPGYPYLPNQYGQAPAPVGSLNTADAIRMWRGTVGAQSAGEACPSCGRADGWFSVIPQAGEASTGAGVNVRARVLRGNSPTSHCFYCGYRETTRGAPSPGIGIPTTNSGEAPRSAHRPANDVHSMHMPYSTAVSGRPIAMERSLVNVGRA